MNDDQPSTVLIKEDVLREMVERLDLVKKFTHATDEKTALYRLNWIDDMIKRRAEQIKTSQHGGPGETLESIFHEYSKRELHYQEFKEYALSLVKAVELMVMHGVEAEDEEQAFQLKTILSTIRGAHEELRLWVPGKEFPCEF